MDKTHTWPFAAGFNARCKARTVAANAIVVGEYPIVSTSRAAPVTSAQATYVEPAGSIDLDMWPAIAPDDSALARVQRIWNGPCKAPAPAPVTNINADTLARITYYVMLWYAEWECDDYAEYCEMRSAREEMEAMLHEWRTPDEIEELFHTCEVAF